MNILNDLMKKEKNRYVQMGNFSREMETIQKANECGENKIKTKLAK